MHVVINMSSTPTITLGPLWPQHRNQPESLWMRYFPRAISHPLTNQSEAWVPKCGDCRAASTCLGMTHKRANSFKFKSKVPRPHGNAAASSWRACRKKPKLKRQGFGHLFRPKTQIWIPVLAFFCHVIHVCLPTWVGVVTGLWLLRLCLPHMSLRCAHLHQAFQSRNLQGLWASKIQKTYLLCSLPQGCLGNPVFGRWNSADICFGK